MRPVPLHVQTQSTECGLASMGMILAHYGRHVDLETLRRISGVSRDCVDAKDLLRIADHFGLSSRVVRTEPDRLSALGFPLVVFTDFIHFTVVEAIDDREVVLADPGFGRHAIPREEFDESFTGVALSFTPSDRFRPGGRRISLVHRILRQLRFCPRGFLIAALAGQVLWALPLLPAILHFAASKDGAAGGVDGDFVRLGLAGGIGTALALAITAWAAARAEDGYSRDRLFGMARHILTQSHAFFVYRVHAVMAQRVGAHDAVAETLFRKLLPAVGGAATIPVLLIATALVHLPSALLVLVLTGLHLGLNLMGDRAAIRKGRVRQDDRDAHWMKLSHSLENFESFKTSGGDREFFNDAMGLCARRLDVRQRTGLFKGAADLSPDLAFWLLLPAILVCCWITLPPGDVPQVLIALTGLTILLQISLRAVARLHGALDGLRFALPPLDDLADSGVETDNPALPMAWPGAGSALSLRDVRFGFSPVKPPLFDRITVSVKPGEWMALTGASGGGKSALAALMIGLHRPWTGAVELDGRPIERIGRADLARRIGWVDKHPFFAPGTIRDNIRLWDSAVTAADIHAAVADACLNDVIAGFPKGLDTPLMARAANLSGGQRQRVELARVLARNPGLIVIDEATDGLDPETERRLFANLRRRGITVLIVSHRASTIEACDRVMRLSDGVLLPGAATAPPRMAAQAGYSPFPEAPETGNPDPAPDFADLAAVFQCVAAASGISSAVHKPLKESGSAHESLTYLARRNRVMLRPVRFSVSAWWRRDTGPLIGFLPESGCPVAIISDLTGRSYVVDPHTGTRQALDDPDLVQQTAYRIYPRFAPRSVRLRDFFLSPLRPIARSLAEVVLADLLLALLCVCGPVAAYLLSVSVEVPPVIWGSGLALWIASILILAFTRLIAQHRIEGILELSTHSALYQHLMRIRPLFVRDHAPQEVNRSLQALPELLALLRGGTLRRLAAGVGALAGLAAVWSVAPSQIVLAAGLLSPFVVIPAWLARGRSAPAFELLQQRPAGRVFLAGLMQSAAKLRQMARTDAALGEWYELVDRERRPAGQVRWREAGADAALHGYCLMAAGWFVWDTAQVTLGPVQQTTAVLAFMLAVFSAFQAAKALCELSHAGPAFRRLRLLASAPVDAASDPHPHCIPGDEGSALELRTLSYRYPGGRRPAVDNVSLRVGRGEVVALTGPSGCGKSTLLRLILGFHAPDSGDILRGGVPSDAVDLSNWREHTGAVLQDDELEHAKTIRGHIGGDHGFSLAEIREAARLAQLHADLDAMPMGIQTIVDSERISTGQKQRILIARRLVRKPKLLILDEATNALPDAMQAEIFAAIRSLGLSCLVVSHRESALSLADRVYRMAEGRLVVEAKDETVAKDGATPERMPEWTP